MKSGRMPLLNVSEKVENLLEKTDETASVDLSKDANRAVEVLSDAMNSVCYLPDADFRDFEDLQEASAGKKLESQRISNCMTLLIM